MQEKPMGALHGIKILDLTCVLSGPFGTSWLSDMGAEIIKVENPVAGDATRAGGPFVNGCSNYFATVNRNKRNVTINLKDPKGKEMLLELVKQVDVVAENFKPGTMDKLGLGYEVLRSVNEKIILASISGYGQNGPYASRPGYDVVAQAMGGIMSYTGFPENPPTKCGPSIGDITAGMNLAIGILAALVRQKMTGKGEWVEVSLVDSVLALTTQDYIDYGHTKNLPPRIGNGYSLWCPYGTYMAADRAFAIGVGMERQWATFCTDIIHKPELIDDPRFCDPITRVQNRAETDALVYEWCGRITAEEAVDQLNAVGIPGALVYNYADIEADENFTVHRQMIKHMQHPVIGDIAYINTPIRFRESGLVEPRPAGALGQFNEEVFGEYLGMSAEEVAQLKKNGTI
ncbi:MAG: CoA transferase [Ruminococcaceae bacterium]|nr:CoA transferase [Oscillospiraceae bacterium]